MNENGDSEELTITDRGTPVNIMNSTTAKHLQLLIVPVPSDQAFTMIVCKKSARESVIGVVEYGDLLDCIHIVKNSKCTLIFYYSSTSKGVIIVQDYKVLFAIAHGDIIFRED